MAAVTTRRARRALRNTPGRLTLALIGLVAGCLALGVFAVVTAESHASAANNLAHRDDRLTVDAQLIYASLADADTTAASTYLQGGTESATARTRYLNDIAAASSALNDATRTAGGGDPAVTADTALLADDLPTYTGLIETARADNRLNLPVGVAYLTEAANLMRAHMLPAADGLFALEYAQLSDDEGGGSAFPYVALLVALILLGGLVYVQIKLSRLTHRTVNVGLAGATLAVLVVLVTMLATLASVGNAIDTGRNGGAAQIQPLARAEIASLRGHGDECLFLVAGGEDATYGTDAATAERQLDAAVRQATGVQTGAPATGAPANRAATQWESAHATLMTDTSNGGFNAAVTSAIGSGTAAKAFDTLDTELITAINRDHTVFARNAAAADSDASGLAPLLAVFMVLAMAGCVVGVGARLREYR